LFFNTLEKYKISEFEPQLKSKFNGEEMVMEGQIEAESESDKGTVAKVIEVGYNFENTVIHKAKVFLYN
jgi:molecular chaperone GrpE (heat shock protein)